MSISETISFCEAGGEILEDENILGRCTNVDK
jgi:hypothetical protein